MNYQSASWRIQLAKGAFVEVSISGLDCDSQSCEAGDVVQAGIVLKEVGRAMDRIATRWHFTLKGESK